MTTEQHRPDDYNCVHWKGDHAGVNLRAKCQVCAQPGYRAAYAKRKRQETSEAIGVFGAVVGFATLLVLLTGFIAHHWPGWF